MLRADWIPAFAGMTWRLRRRGAALRAGWIPAYAGMTIGYAKVSSGRGAGGAVCAGCAPIYPQGHVIPAKAGTYWTRSAIRSAIPLPPRYGAIAVRNGKRRKPASIVQMRLTPCSRISATMCISWTRLPRTSGLSRIVCASAA